MFAGALTYPLRRSGWIVILGGAIFSVILHVLQFAPLVGLLVAVFSAGYFGAFYLDIISTTMTGGDELPDWPSVTSFWDDIGEPLFRLMAVAIVSFAPLIGLFFAAADQASWFAGALFGLMAFGCFYFPMAILAVQAFGGVGAALPHIVLPGIFKALPGYLLVASALAAVSVTCAFAEELSGRIPFIGWFLASAVALYGLIFQGRLIGLIYVEKREKLDWE